MEKFVANGRRELLDAFDHEVRVVIAPLSAEEIEDVQSNILLATARRRRQTKLH